MVLMALPSMFGPVASVVAAVLALVAGVAFKRPNVRMEKPHDWQAEYNDIELRVRKPWQYRAKVVGRWFDGDR